jgi:hypothetical protein
MSGDTKLILVGGPDGGASLSRGDRVVASAHECWFDGPAAADGLPHQAIRFCLERSGLALRDVGELQLLQKPTDPAPARGGLFQRLLGRAPSPDAGLRRLAARVDPEWRGEVVLGAAGDGPASFLTLAAGQDGRIGPEFSQTEIEKRLTAAGAVFEVFDEASIAFATAEELNLGRHVAWAQGQTGFGPDALTARCVLCDPRSTEAMSLLTSRLWRPRSSLNLLVAAEGQMADLPGRSWESGHALHEIRDQRLFRVLRQLADFGGAPALAATPLAMAAEPVACTPEAAFHLFLSAEIEVLVIGCCYLVKRRQSIELKARYAYSYDPHLGNPMKERAPLRVVRLADRYPYGDYPSFQLNFMDQVNHRLIPSTRVYVGDDLVFETNALCCKGPEVEPGVPIVGIFGDSVMQGTGMDSIPRHVSIGPCQPLNGGVEGSRLQHTVDRFLEVQAKAPMTCIAFHTGWHNLVYGETGEDFWREQLDRVEGPPVIAHFRLVADFHPDALTRGYDRFFGDDYAQWHDGLHTRVENLPAFKAALDAFNDFIARYCAEKGRVLIDLEPVLAPKSYAAISNNFTDLIHPRPGIYRVLGEAISEQLRPHVLPLVGAGEAPVAPAPIAPAGPTSAPETGRTYPLW